MPLLGPWMRVLDALPCGLVVSLADGRIAYANAALGALVGAEPDALQGESLESVVRPEGDEWPEGPGAVAYLFCRHRAEPLTVEAQEVPLAGPAALAGARIHLLRPMADAADSAGADDASVRYQALMRLIPEAVWLYDPDSLRFLEVNETAIQRYGYSRDEWLGMTVLDIRPEEQREAARQSVRSIPMDRLGVYEGWTHRRRDGTCFPVNIYARLHQFNGRRVVLAIAVDASASRQADLRVQQAERLYQRVVASLPLGITVLRQTGPEQLIVEYVNPVCEQLMGVRSVEVLGRPVLEVFPGAPMDPAIFNTPLEAWRDREVAYEDARGRRLFHSRLFRISREQIVVAFEDITPRKATEQALRASEQRYRTLVESSADAIFTLDENLIYTSVNEATCRFFDQPPERFLGQPLGRIATSEPSVQFVRTRLQQCLRTGEPLMLDVDIEVQARLLQLNLSVSPVRDASGQFRQLICIGRDVTQLRKMEQGLREAHKLEALGRLAGGVAHDFNNLLACIQGNLDLALSGRLDAAQARQGLSDARLAARHAGELVRQILTYTRQGPCHPERVELNRVAREVLEIIATGLPAAIAVRQELADDLWPVRVDPGQALQLVMNLAINAHEAMGQAGTLSLRTSNVVLGGSPGRGEAPQTGRYVCLEVCDTGPGIPPELTDRVFEPFFTTKPVGEGSGLGLAVVYGIARNAGGWVEFASRPGQTRFSVYLPRDRE